ncbi:histidine phosphatase family protein [Sphingomonas sp. S2-65]|uniref:histidine phosphatase family protein n=1 Tax=Sphingomonas sp. S2-65 TaxID=2903960 RepID=UPI001F1858CE|nr:histidine phosphatase family protein [Sphingomonas sp. S2-65]UYY58634.1 histidine phosphatase family protein [Sphingomonas sp. S2-65]
MTATIFLIRHASHAHLGKILSGRLGGIGLTSSGISEAERLADHLRLHDLAAIQSSPVQRARETAAAIAAGRGLDVDVAEALDEIDFGDWTGSAFEALVGDPEWDRWNDSRATAAPPCGESMAAAQARVVAHLRALAGNHPSESVAVVTHCDIIRAALAHVLGLSLDDFHRFDVDPASVSRIAMGDWGARVLSINEVCR